MHWGVVDEVFHPVYRETEHLLGKDLLFSDPALDRHPVLRGYFAVRL
jgi:hypothetical protein